MAAMPTLYDSLKERKLVQWTVAYVVVAWLVLEVLAYLAGTFLWPAVVTRGATVLAGVGLLTVVVLAWYHGERGHQRMGAVEALLLAGLLVLAGTGLAMVVRSGPVEESTGPGAWSVASIPSATVDRRIAVLPLANLSSGGEGDEYLVDGLHEEIRSLVSRIRGLDVLARTSLMRFKDRSGRDVPEIAAELGVRHVLDGSVRRSASRIRVSVQLLDTHTRGERWSETYERELSAAALFDIQSDVALQIARALEFTLSPTERESIERRGTESDEAYDIYLRGLYDWLKYSPRALESANAYFQEAVQLDPGFAKAWSALGDSYVGMGNMWVLHPGDAFPKAKAAALRAIELDQGLAQAYVMLGWVYLSYEQNWREADRLVRRAVELSPGEQESHYLLAHWLQAMGRFGEAVREGQVLMELDPLSAPMYKTAGRMLQFARRYDEALETFRRGVTLDSEEPDPHFWIGVINARIGRPDEAVASLREVWRLDGLGDPDEVTAAYEEDGMPGVWRLWLELELESGRAGSIAAFYALRGEQDLALEWLERAYQERDAWLFQLNDPLWDPLRGDPRFADLIRRLDLPAVTPP